MSNKFKENENAPLVTNKNGGSQSKLDYDYSLLPWDALLPVIQVLEEGAKKYGRDNWKKIDTDDHVSHALAHAISALNTQGEDQVVHLTHIVCRALFAIHTINTQE